MNRKKGVHFDNDPLMLRIELTKVDKPEHKIDFKLFFLSKTACAKTNLLEQ
jgi:hypothetical protein